jgi:hypothetical protein
MFRLPYFYTWHGLYSFNILIVDNATAQSQRHPLVALATQVLTTLFARLKSDRANLADDESALVQQLCLQK